MISLLFAKLFGAFKRYTVLVSMAAVALSFTLLALSAGPAGVFAGAIVYGVYLGTIIPYLQTAVSGVVHPYRRTYALSILSTAMFAGQAASSVYVGVVESIIGPSTAALFEVIYLLATRKHADFPYGNMDGEGDTLGEGDATESPELG